MDYSNQQLGWKPFFQNQITLDELESSFSARISKIYRTKVLIWSQRGSRRSILASLAILEILLWATGC